MKHNPYQVRDVLPDGCTTVYVQKYGDVIIHTDEELTKNQKSNIRNQINRGKVDGTYWSMAGILETDKDERKYVIVCNEHNGIVPGALLFWGHRTSKNAQRSFGGYTSDLDSCELYSRSDIDYFRRDIVEHFPYFHELTKPFHKYEDVVCTVQDLENIGYRQMNVMVK